MSKRTWSILLAGALVASVFSVMPAKAGPVPDVVQIDDPACDANPTGAPTAAGCQGNVSSVGDLQKIWFTNDADTISLHIQTTLSPPAGSVGIYYELLATPGEGPVSSQDSGCLFIRAVFPAANAGGTYQGERIAKLLDRCNDGTHFFDNGIEGEIEVEDLEDGTGLTHLTFPRSYSPLLADGETIVAPWAQDYGAYGTDKISLPATPVRSAGPPLIGLIRYDVTDPGSDYQIQSEEPEPEPTTAPPGKNDPPGKKKGCKKGSQKAKKKGCKKNKNQGKKKGKGKKKGPKTPVVKACDPYEPGENGAEAETLVVTNEATEEAPVELTVPTSPGVGAGRNPGSYGALVSHAYVNLQVDVEAASGGLWVKLSSADYQDYDLYLDLADGTQVAVSGGFGPEQDSEEGDSHTDFGSEMLTGIKTDDCGGYTLDVVGAATQGGDTTLTAWIGDELWDPVAGAPTP